MLHTDDEQKPTALSRLEEHKRDCKKTRNKSYQSYSTDGDEK